MESTSKSLELPSKNKPKNKNIDTKNPERDPSGRFRYKIFDQTEPHSCGHGVSFLSRCPECELLVITHAPVHVPTDL